MFIGKSATGEIGGTVETLLEQLRQRQLSIEQVGTFTRQRVLARPINLLAAEKLGFDPKPKGENGRSSQATTSNRE